MSDDSCPDSEDEAGGRQSQKDKDFYYDARKDLHFRWCVPKLKQIPLLRVRNYFGEKIALYFAWVETMILSLWIPAFLGIFVFVFGLSQSTRRFSVLLRL